MTKPVDIEAERAICAAASPGPWRVIKDSHKNGRYFPSLVVVPDGVDGGCHGGKFTINEAAPQTLEGCDATADFMARARTLVPELLDEIEQLRKVVAGALDDLDYHNPASEHANTFIREQLGIKR